MASLASRICLVLLLSLSFASLSRGEWSQEFKLKDYLGIYNFPEELISYPLDFKSHTVKKDDLRLFLKGTNVPLVFQLTDVEEANGVLKKAVIHFRTDLKIGEVKAFTLVQNAKVPQAQGQPIGQTKMDGNRLALEANQLQVMVPDVNGDVNLRISDAPAPLLALAREPGKWVGSGKFEAPGDLKVQKINTRVIEDGPLFLKYGITYTFSDDRWYYVELTLQQNESYVGISEYAKGFGPTDQLVFRFSYKDGLDPNGRLLMANGGYSTGGPQQGASGNYDQGLSPTGELPIKLGLYTPNSINLPRAIAFWNDNGSNALLLSLWRLPEWKTSTRALWSCTSLPDNIEFYDKDGDKFLRAAIVGSERHWVASLIPRADMIVRGVPWGDVGKIPRPPDKTWEAVSSMAGFISYGGGPEVRLVLKLNDFSLNRYKDLVFDFPESSTSTFTLPDIPAKEMTGDDFRKAFGNKYCYIAQVGWDVSGELGPNQWGWSTGPQAVDYAFNYPKWSPADHLQFRSWLVFAAYMLELDTAMPQSSMLGGHPNFAVEFKQILGIDPGLFPKHPDAKRWRDTYLSFFKEWLDRYIRKPDATTGAKGGRFTENISNYSYASQEAVMMAATGLKRFDGTQILDHPEVRDWLRWDMECRLPFRVEDARIVPPEGAHSAVSPLCPGGRWWKTAHSMALLLKDTAPNQAEEWLWSITNGKEGKKPTDIQSSLYVDYGPVFRYDFGGPNEAYLQLQQLNGIGYRWSPASNGALYYAAKGKAWSWNTREAAGDEFDIDKIPLFHCEGKVSLGAALADSVLYNFDFAQYYQAMSTDTALTPPPYKYRSVMMVRGDYLAIFDHVQDGVSGAFQWVNESSGVEMEIFSDPELKKPLRTLSYDERFPQSVNDDLVKVLGLPKTFSIRETGNFTVPVAGHYKFKTSWQDTPTVPAGDTVRMYLDDKQIFNGMGPATSEVDLEAKTYALRYEYVHASNDPPYFMLGWTSPPTIEPNPTKYTNAQVGLYEFSSPLPFVQEVKGGPGDQFHIVAPEKIAVVAVPSGAKIGNGEFVMVSDQSQNVTQDGLTFKGKVAYARAGELALFDGTDLQLGGLGLSRDDGDFGASLKQVDSKSLEGRVAGRTGGMLHVHLPPGFPTDGLKVTFDGHTLPARVENGILSLPIGITQADGTKEFRIAAK
jgi:hypothetical protein